MTRPPLTLALTSVLAAAVDGPDRPGLLATLRPDIAPSTGATSPELSEEAKVIPLPRVIPMPRRGPADPDPDPSSAA